jgi:hypothetical protein
MKWMSLDSDAARSITDGRYTRASRVTIITNLSHFVSTLMQHNKDVGDGQKQYGKSNLNVLISKSGF